MVIGIVLVFLLSFRYSKKLKVNKYDLIIIAAAAIGTGLFGASTLYILVSYSFEEIYSQIISGDLRFLSGGLVYYGSFIGGIFGSFVAIKATKVPFNAIEKSIMPYLPLGHAVGRIGCIMAGCCHGFSYEGPFAIHYSDSILDLPADQGFFPVQILEAIINCIVVIILLWRRRKYRYAGELIALYLILYSTARFFMEFLRGDEIRGQYLNLSTSQWISVVLFSVSLTFFIYTLLKNKRNSKKEYTMN